MPANPTTEKIQINLEVDEGGLRLFIKSDRDFPTLRAAGTVTVTIGGVAIHKPKSQVVSGEMRFPIVVPSPAALSSELETALFPANGSVPNVAFLCAVGIRDGVTFNLGDGIVTLTRLQAFHRELVNAAKLLATEAMRRTRIEGTITITIAERI